MLEVTGRPNILNLPVMLATRLLMSGVSSQLVKEAANLFKLLGDLHLKPR